jgi:hypothetical protein
VVTPRAEALIREVFAKHALPASAYESLVDDVDFDLGEHAAEKLTACGASAERQYTIRADALRGRFWFRFEIDFDALPREARVLDCRFIPFHPLG